MSRSTVPGTDHITASMHRYAIGGEVVGTITEAPDSTLIGKTIFIWGTIPGETVHAQITESHPRYTRGVLTSILSPHATLRATPPCALFGQCGGCDLQHITQDAQREIKRTLVCDTLTRALGRPIDAQDRSNGIPFFGYRRRARFHLALDGTLGFVTRDPILKICNATQCQICTPRIRESAAVFASQLAPYTHHIHGVTFEDHGPEHPITVILHPREGADIPKELPRQLTTPTHTVRTISATAPEGHFIQGNEVGNEILRTVVQELLPSSPSAITELYAGSGNFTEVLLARGHTVEAVEADRSLATQLSHRFASSMLTVHCDTVKRFITTHRLNATVLLDPPRVGAVAFTDAARPKTTQRIIYVSCSLPTFARDVTALERHGYRLRSVTTVDMFSQTHHIEIVGVLEAQ